MQKLFSKVSSRLARDPKLAQACGLIFSIPTKEAILMANQIMVANADYNLCSTVTGCPVTPIVPPALVEHLGDEADFLPSPSSGKFSSMDVRLQDQARTYQYAALLHRIGNTSCYGPCSLFLNATRTSSLRTW